MGDVTFTDLIIGDDGTYTLIASGANEENLEIKEEQVNKKSTEIIEYSTSLKLDFTYSIAKLLCEMERKGASEVAIKRAEGVLRSKLESAKLRVAIKMQDDVSRGVSVSIEGAG